ncbi:hypothetical protein [Clostridium estertheticum]|nr:hypothetical protein [Clostridium estertheticum]
MEELTPAIDDIYSLYPSKIKDIDGDGLLEAKEYIDSLCEKKLK